MSDNIKLIVEIPKNYYEIIKYEVDHHISDYRPFVIIANGTPLEDVKAEIANINTFERAGCWVMKDVFKVLDNIGKAESEDKE